MNLWEYLDRQGERKLRRPPFDTRILIAGMFLLGYYALVYGLMTFVIPAENVPLLRDMLLVLGPGVGLILGAIFRNDRRDDQATANTGAAFRAIEAAAGSSGSGQATGRPGDPVHTREEG